MAENFEADSGLNHEGIG
jgi:hypothetical protein